MTIDMEQDATVKVTEDQLTQLSKLVEWHSHLVQDIEAQETTLKRLTQELRKAEEQDIPSVMDEAGIETFTTVEGVKVKIQENLYASIAKKNKKPAAEWLLNNGLGSLVQENVSVVFMKGEHVEAEKTMELLRVSGVAPQLTENINTASVKAAIKELMADGKTVPMELFGAHIVRKAIIKN